MKIKVYKDKGVQLPTYGSALAAAMDIRANEDKIILPGETQIIKTGLYFEIPEGYMLNLVSRSGMSVKGIVVGNAFAVIDADYRGELQVILRNTHLPNPNNDNIFKVAKGDRIAQALVLPIPLIEWEEVKSKNDLGKTERGAGGLGSTGSK